MNEDLNVSPPNKVGDGENKYSLEETVIGEWIDGKPIYRKVITLSLNNYKNDKTENILQNVPEINDLIRMDGFFINKNNTKLPLNYYDSSNSYYIFTRLFGGNKNISFSTSRSDLISVYLILEYTKTTD